LIVIAFAAVAVQVLLLGARYWLLTGIFPLQAASVLLVGSVLFIRLLLRSEWAKYGGIVWSLLNAVVSVHAVVAQGQFVYVGMGAASLYLFWVLGFSPSVENYMHSDLKNSNVLAER